MKHAWEINNMKQVTHQAVSQGQPLILLWTASGALAALEHKAVLISPKLKNIWSFKVSLPNLGCQYLIQF